MFWRRSRVLRPLGERLALVLAAVTGCADLKSASSQDADQDGGSSLSDAGTEGGLASDGKVSADGGAADGSTTPDRRYALWPLPPTQPPLSEYDIGAGSIVDHVTGLVWQKGYSSATSKQEPAGVYCAGLDLDGQKDWRLPTRIELMTLFDYGQTTYPLVNESVFALPPSSDQGTQVWTASASLLRARLDDRYVVDLRSGSTLVTGGSEADFLAKCVRGGPTTGPAKRLDVSGGATVVDVRTTLTWRTAAQPSALSFANAQSACTSLGGGWRLPTTRELVTLVDEARDLTPLLPLDFPSGPENTFWSVTPSFSPTEHHRAIDFGTGNSADIADDELHAVRCVR